MKKLKKCKHKLTNRTKNEKPTQNEQRNLKNAKQRMEKWKTTFNSDREMWLSQNATCKVFRMLVDQKYQSWNYIARNSLTNLEKTTIGLIEAYSQKSRRFSYVVNTQIIFRKYSYTDGFWSISPPSEMFWQHRGWYLCSQRELVIAKLVVSKTKLIFSLRQTVVESKTGCLKNQIDFQSAPNGGRVQNWLSQKPVHLAMLCTPGGAISAGIDN